MLAEDRRNTRVHKYKEIIKRYLHSFIRHVLSSVYSAQNKHDVLSLLFSMPVCSVATAQLEQLVLI